jgi:predicted RecB family nuclease
MPLTVEQTTAFFEQDAQMGIPNETVVQLQQEGITTVDDLVDFDKDTIEQIAANLRRPAGRIPDPNPAAAPGATIPTPSFVFGAKSQKRLITASTL